MQTDEELLEEVRARVARMSPEAKERRIRALLRFYDILLKQPAPRKEASKEEQPAQAASQDE